MNPALLVGGFPEFKADNTPFGKADYTGVVKETRQHATAIAHDLDLSSFQVGYDSDTKRMEPPNPEPFGLELSCRQRGPSPAPPSSTTPMILAPPRANGEDMVLESLSSIRWQKESAEQSGEGGSSQGQTQQEKASEPEKNKPASGVTGMVKSPADHAAGSQPPPAME